LPDRQNRIDPDYPGAGQPNDEYSYHPVKKLPALITDNGEVIVDSYVIVEYLDDLAAAAS